MLHKTHHVPRWTHVRIHTTNTLKPMRTMTMTTYCRAALLARFLMPSAELHVDFCFANWDCMQTTENKTRDWLSCTKWQILHISFFFDCLLCNSNKFAHFIRLAINDKFCWWSCEQTHTLTHTHIYIVIIYNIYLKRGSDWGLLVWCKMMSKKSIHQTMFGLMIQWNGLCICHLY